MNEATNETQPTAEETKIAKRKEAQRKYYATKGKDVRRKYYEANIDDKRRQSREYQRKRRELFKEYQRIALEQHAA